MLRLFYYKTIVVLAVLSVFCSCSGKNTSKKHTYTPSEIVSHFIKQKTHQQVVNGVYVFACGVYCKGCVQSNLQQIDSLYGISDDKNWHFYTSHRFVSKYKFKHITFDYDTIWESVNYPFSDVIVLRFSNDSIIASEILSEPYVK